MSKISFTDAFGSYGATLPNPQWAFSAIAPDGALVMSCWQHKFTMPEKGLLRYSDSLSRWKHLNHPGRNLFIKHLTQAYTEKLPVRLIIVSTHDTAKVDAGEDVSRLHKDFDVRQEFVGQVTSFDGEAYLIDFKSAMPLDLGTPDGDRGDPNKAIHLTGPRDAMGRPQDVHDEGVRQC